MKYSWKEKALQKMEIARLNCWEKMIKTESLERKIQGIKNIKTYLENLGGETKLHMMLYGTIEDVKAWVEETQIIELIFCHNEHH